MLRRLFRRRQAPAPSSVPTHRSRFALIGGRRYDNASSYVLPKDIGEINRLDYQHFIFRLLMKGNYATPVGVPRVILDVGTGTGRWAMEMADAFPAAQVAAVDLPANTLAIPHTPVNLRYSIGDVTQGLDFPDNTFDFTHMRLLVAAMPANKWQFAVNELVRVTKPGGWVECVESPLAEGTGTWIQKLNEWIDAICKARGVDFQLAANVDAMLYQTGLISITKREIPIRMGARGGLPGTMMERNYLTGVNALKPLIVDQFHLTDEAGYAQVMERVSAEIQQGTVIAPFFAVYGQKPSRR